ATSVRRSSSARRRGSSARDTMHRTVTGEAFQRFTGRGRHRRAPGSLSVMPDPTADAVVRQMRDAIIDNDLRLLVAATRRRELAARLRAYKESQGMEFVDHSREEWMRRYLQGANQGPLSAIGLDDIYRHLLELTKRETNGGAPADGGAPDEP